jgi:S1-C subfamily serine protease
LTRGAAVFVLVASILGGATGGAVASVLARLADTPAPSRIVTSGTAATDVSSAAEAVLPAVVTILVGSGSAAASGTGLVIDKARGYVVTSSHVVQLPRSTRANSDVTILLGDGRTLGATVVGNDINTDVALLRADGALPAEAVLSMDTVKVGAPVIAIGTPGVNGLTIGALASTVTSGVVSATGRRIPREDLRSVIMTDLIQTDALIASGMSGGPLVLVSSGRVIGLNTITVRGEGDLAFAISAATVRRVADEMIAKGTP